MLDEFVVAARPEVEDGAAGALAIVPPPPPPPAAALLELEATPAFAALSFPANWPTAGSRKVHSLFTAPEASITAASALARPASVWSVAAAAAATFCFKVATADSSCPRAGTSSAEGTPPRCNS